MKYRISNRKTLRPAWSALAALGLCGGIALTAGCSVTGSLSRQGASAALLHSTKMQREQHAPKEDTASYIRIEHTDGRPTEYYLPTVTLENGERVMSVQLGEVVVVARSRSIPERMGKVDVDFVITLPEMLQGTCRNIVVTPVLHNRDERIPLEEVSIRGALFDKVQVRDYWQYGRYLDIHRPDSVRAMQAFDRFVRFPYPQDVRLDSVQAGRSDISYFYTQQVPTAKVGKSMRITLEGRVLGLDGSVYELPPSDTLLYHISSMLNFTDTTTRYVQRIVSKYARVQDRNYLSFPVGESRIVDTLPGNAYQLGRIEKLMEELVEQHEFHIDSIVLSASASPDGSASLNRDLSAERAGALVARLRERFPDAGLDTLLAVRPLGENWTRLRDMIRDNPRVTNRAEILALMEREKNPDRREALMRQRYPEDYAYLRETVFPLLRSVDFRYELRRVGMIRDTVLTTEVDTLYLRGRRLLEERRYTDALRVLRPYGDRNTAIALLSLGHDREAYEILCRQPLSAVREYLQAIACARLGQRRKATGHYREAVRLDPDMEYRAGLDPELNELIHKR